MDNKKNLLREMHGLLEKIEKIADEPAVQTIKKLRKESDKRVH